MVGLETSRAYSNDSWSICDIVLLLDAGDTPENSLKSSEKLLCILLVATSFRIIPVFTWVNS